MEGYIRVYKGGMYPARFNTVGWCTAGELQDVLKDGWIIDTNNLFGPDGKYPTKEPIIKKDSKKGNIPSGKLI